MDKHRKSNACSTSAEADHRIANHFAMLASHVRLKTAALVRRPTEPSRSEMLLLLESIGVHIDAVASLHRILATEGLQSSADLGQHLRNICSAFRSGPSSGFVLAEDFEPGCALPLDQLLPVTQIFSEVITNAIKYGIANGEAGRFAPPAARTLMALFASKSSTKPAACRRASTQRPIMDLGFDWCRR